MSLRRTVPFEGSYWVVPGRFLAGCYPGSRHPVRARERLAALLDVGIRCIINLMYDYETDWRGEPVRPYEDEVECLSAGRDMIVHCLRMPVPELSIPTRTTMKLILNRIDSAIRQGRPVYVHCWSGRGRTGTVVGCYLARHGIAEGKSAIAKIAELRKKDVSCFLSSPDNERQRWMIYSWPEKE